MDWINWVPSAVLVAVIYFLRDQIADYFNKRSQHGFNEKLERLRSELAASSADIVAFRSGALNAGEQRQVMLNRRRLEANEQVWTAVIALKPIITASTYLAALKFEAAAKLAEQNEDARKMFSDMAQGGGWHAMPKHEAQTARMFVSPITWSLFSAYQMVLGYSFTRWAVLTTGVGPEAPLDDKIVIDFLVSAMPDWKERIEEGGEKIFPKILYALEERILNQIRFNLEGHEDELAAVDRAVSITARANELKLKMDEAKAEVVNPV